jgi:hypothetical protein
MGPAFLSPCVNERTKNKVPDIFIPAPSKTENPIHCALYERENIKNKGRLV